MSSTTIHSIENLTVTNNRLYDYDIFFLNYLKAENLTKLDISFQNIDVEPTSCESFPQPMKKSI